MHIISFKINYVIFAKNLVGQNVKLENCFKSRVPRFIHETEIY